MRFAKSRLIAMLFLNAILFSIWENLSLWHGFALEIYWSWIAVVISVIPLVNFVSFAIYGEVWQRLVAWLLAIFPTLFFLTAITTLFRHFLR